MTNKKEELEKYLEYYKNSVTDRILAVAAMKSIMNDAAWDRELAKVATTKLSLAFAMEDSYEKRVSELQKEIEEEKLAQQQPEEPDSKARAKAILGIGGQE